MFINNLPAVLYTFSSTGEENLSNDQDVFLLSNCPLYSRDLYVGDVCQVL